MTDSTTKNGAKAPPENTDAWIPEDVGDTLRGEVIDVDSAWSDWRAQQNPADPAGGFYPLLTIRQEGTGDVVKLHGFRTVLFNELVKREPIPGEVIEVTYVGTGEAKKAGMNPPEVYRVSVPGRPPEAARSIYRGMNAGGRVAPGTRQDAAPAPAPPAAAADPVAAADAAYGETLPG